MKTDIEEIIEFLEHIQPKIGFAAFDEIYQTAENLQKKIKQIKNNVDLHNVRQQRELLIAYENKVRHMDKLRTEKFVDGYLNTKGN